MAVVATDSARMHQMMAHELAKQGNTAAAIANYREAIKIDPRLPGIHFELPEMLNADAPTENREEISKQDGTQVTANTLYQKAESRLAEIVRRTNNRKQPRGRYPRGEE